MQSQEYHEDMDGNIDQANYKNQWSASDEGYYFVSIRYTENCRFIMYIVRYFQMQQM